MNPGRYSPGSFTPELFSQFLGGCFVEVGGKTGIPVYRGSLLFWYVPWYFFTVPVFMVHIGSLHCEAVC